MVYSPAAARIAVPQEQVHREFDILPSDIKVFELFLSHNLVFIDYIFMSSGYNPDYSTLVIR